MAWPVGWPEVGLQKDGGGSLNSFLGGRHRCRIERLLDVHEFQAAQGSRQRNMCVNTFHTHANQLTNYEEIYQDRRGDLIVHILPTLTKRFHWQFSCPVLLRSELSKIARYYLCRIGQTHKQQKRSRPALFRTLSKMTHAGTCCRAGVHACSKQLR